MANPLKTEHAIDWSQTAQEIEDHYQSGMIERDRYRETTREFLSTVLTVKVENQPEWMEYLAERINEVCEVIGEEDRVHAHPLPEAPLNVPLRELHLFAGAGGLTTLK